MKPVSPISVVRSGVVLVFLAGCDASQAAAPAGSLPALAANRAKVPDAGCDLVFRAADDRACRGEWNCGVQTHRSVICLSADAGVLCSCFEDTDGDEDHQHDAGQPRRISGSCTTGEQVTLVAQQTCLWDVP